MPVTLDRATPSTPFSGIENKLAAGSERHRDFARSLDTIDVRTSAMQTELNKIAPLAISVSDMEPKVTDLVEFKGRMAAIILVASTMVGFASWFLWEGVKYLFPTAGRDFIYRLFH